jgi:hypothetical protein
MRCIFRGITRRQPTVDLLAHANATGAKPTRASAATNPNWQFTTMFACG